MSKKQTPKQDGLVGKFFHTFVDGQISWQGLITGEPASGYFLVQLFEWLCGGPSDKRLIHVSQMVGWTFYDEADDWRHEADMKTYRAKRADREKQNAEGQNETIETN